MPIIKSAKKKNRRDQRRKLVNLQKRTALKKIVKTARQNSSPANLLAMQKALDKAVRSRMIHRNKANRIKSRLAHRTKA